MPEGLTQEQADRAREAVRRQLQTFARELVSSLQFYQNQPGSLGIGEIVITGGTARLRGLADELQRLIGVRVAVGDPLLRVKLGRKLREADGSSARSPSQSASGSRTDVRAINLLPRDDTRRGPQKTQCIVLVPVVLAVLLAAVLSAMFLSAQRQGEGQAGRARDAPGRARAIPTPDAEQRQDADGARRRQAGARDGALSSALAPGRLGPRLP